MTTAFDSNSQPFADGLARGELAYQACSQCGATQKLARYACRTCGSTALTWKTSSGKGVVYATTVVSRAPSDGFKPLVPYTLVLVDLDEGARLMGHAQAGVAIGDKVAAGFFEHDGRRLIRFRRLEKDSCK